MITTLSVLAIGVTVTVSKTQKTTETIVQATDTTICEVTQPAKNTEQPVVSTSSILFKDERLEVIMQTIADHYIIGIEYKTDATKELQLYYRFDPTLPLEEVIEQLNTFEQINIRISGKTIIVD